MASLQQILANRWSFSSIITSTFGVATVIPTSNRGGNWVLKRWINISKVTHLASVRAGISQSPKPIVFLPNHPARDKPFQASLLGDGEEFGAALSLSSVKTTGDSGLRNTDCQALSPAGNMWKGSVQVLRTQMCLEANTITQQYHHWAKPLSWILGTQLPSRSLQTVTVLQMGKYANVKVRP